tara:strand:- start:163 stop:1587 length:1425 start_codon:yes stop_codon:yes gene_type:complete
MQSQEDDLNKKLKACREDTSRLREELSQCEKQKLREENIRLRQQLQRLKTSEEAYRKADAARTARRPRTMSQPRENGRQASKPGIIRKRKASRDSNLRANAADERRSKSRDSNLRAKAADARGSAGRRPVGEQEDAWEEFVRLKNIRLEESARKAAPRQLDGDDAWYTQVPGNAPDVRGAQYVYAEDENDEMRRYRKLPDNLEFNLSGQFRPRVTKEVRRRRRVRWLDEDAEDEINPIGQFRPLVTKEANRARWRKEAAEEKASKLRMRKLRKQKKIAARERAKRREAEQRRVRQIEQRKVVRFEGKSGWWKEMLHDDSAPAGSTVIGGRDGKRYRQLSPDLWKTHTAREERVAMQDAEDEARTRIMEQLNRDRQFADRDRERLAAKRAERERIKVLPPVQFTGKDGWWKQMYEGEAVRIGGETFMELDGSNYRQLPQQTWAIYDASEKAARVRGQPRRKFNREKNDYSNTLRF